MPFKKADFVTSAPSLDVCPDPYFPEICFAGRSNVGKSSLINALVDHKGLARTSNVPGKTQQMNYYQVNDKLFLVDLPGFGYAQVSKEERERWGRDIRDYLLERSTLRLVLHLVDIRHEPSDLDEEFFYWLGTNRLPFAVVLSKADKLSYNKQKQSEMRLKRILDEMNIEVPIVVSSTKDKKGIGEVKQLITEFAEF
ncbi:YihA family ribosome biogenesis GTP-binding protein [Aliifodinibius salipaludis]|uniref:Probable GTP-binding protein EngB n=1 Tax=Fodinibius salipaludis TaxID=2032627 RepID=A0A2A2GBN1_9BACT|nr:ribosome biogenesis GTP-binding protein YihA/YsxC [Aliifodinibius salipaludis]PAU94394.1 YihA family ribosome biogenesis GTP-binding protein [Aliifodinibius salipaludis]